MLNIVDILHAELKKTKQKKPTIMVIVIWLVLYRRLLNLFQYLEDVSPYRNYHDCMTENLCHWLSLQVQAKDLQAWLQTCSILNCHCLVQTDWTGMFPPWYNTFRQIWTHWCYLGGYIPQDLAPVAQCVKVWPGLPTTALPAWCSCVF